MLRAALVALVGAVALVGCDAPRPGVPAATGGGSPKNGDAERGTTPENVENAGGGEDPLGIAGWFRRRARGPAHPLDEVPRRIEAGEALRCGEYRAALVSHRGQAVRYSGPVRVHPGFVPRLRVFEETVRDVAVEVYGRAPRKIRHAGTFACRPVRRRATRISEHAFGNAIDVAAFEFGPARRGQALPEGAPSSLRRSFVVRIDRHWSPGPRGLTDAMHSTFLRVLTQRLGDRDDVFRGMIGPAHPDHRGHLHLDAGPYTYRWM